LDNIRNTIVIGAISTLRNGRQKFASPRRFGKFTMEGRCNGSRDCSIGSCIKLLEGMKNSQLLFIGFSGEEILDFGFQLFVKIKPIELSTVNYMINMDMVK